MNTKTASIDRIIALFVIAYICSATIGLRGFGKMLEDELLSTRYYIKGSSPNERGMGFTIVARDWKDNKITRWALMWGPLRFRKSVFGFRTEQTTDNEYIRDAGFDTVEEALDAYKKWRKAHPERFNVP